MRKLFTLFLVLSTSIGTLFAQSGTCGDNLTWNLTNGVLTISGSGAMANYSNVGKKDAPWYSYRSTITSVTIGNSVTSIGNYAFNSCSSITSVTIGNNVTSIGHDAFSGCSSLSGNLVIPSSVISIGSGTFYDCSSLTGVTIPNSVINIEGNVFLKCTRLSSIVVANGNVVYDSRDNCNALIETSSNTLMAGCKNTIIPNSVTSIGDDAFFNCTGLKSVTIGSSITSIGKRAFRGCSGLTSVSIGNSVTILGDDAFRGCSNLTCVTIGNSVTNIESGAFFDCTNLTSIEIPYSVIYIGQAAFDSNAAPQITSVIWRAKSAFSDYLGVNRFGFFVGYNVESFVFGDSVEVIPPSCCYGMRITSIIIPNSVTSIGESAFEQDGYLTSITCKAVLPPTCDGVKVFEDVNKSTPLYVPEESIADYQTANIWKEFFYIKAIGSTYYIVIFADEDGTVLKTEHVEYGQAATAPTTPTREGYTFTGWDKEFSNVTSDMTVTAQYSINSYTVTFVDWDGTKLKTEHVEYGQSATAPVDPTREGYTFTGWDKDFSNVTSDLTVTAQYSINTYIVQFVNWGNTILKTDTVEYGQSATAPVDPTRKGYTFAGWDKDFSNVTSDLTVTAQYKQNDSSMTCAEAREAALGGSTDEVSVIGYVTDILFAWDATYKNISFWMADNKDGGKVLEAYRINCATQAEAPVVGDKVKVTGKLTVYNSTTPEIDAGGTFEILERVSGDEVDDVTVTSPAEGYATIVINIPEGSECNGIAFKGTMDGSTWSSPNTYVGETKVNASTDECIKFTKIEGTRTWYKATYKLGTIGLIGKICLIYPDDNYWEGQAINYSIIDAKTTANASIDDDGNIVITNSGLAYIKINDWQDSKCAESITVSLQASSAAAWSAVKLFYWGDDISGPEWPGIAVTNTDGWYSYTFASSIKSVNIIWTDGEGDQTVDINDVTASTCYKLNSLSGEKRTVTIVDCSAGELPEDAMTCAEARDAALGGSTNEVTVIGYVTEYVYLWSSSFNSVSFWMADTKDGGKVFEAYRAKCETAAEAPNVGDKVKIVGKLSVYNQATPEISNGTFEILERTSEKTYYTIRFINWDGTELQSLPVEFATTPEYTGATPLRTDDEYYTYEFSGWTPTISPAIKNFTYKATYKGSPKEVHGQAEET